MAVGHLARAWRFGKQHAQRGGRSSGCPYSPGKERDAWMEGFRVGESSSKRASTDTASERLNRERVRARSAVAGSAGIIPTIRVEQHCDLCGQVRDESRQYLEAAEVTLLGAARYASCVVCGRQVPKPWSSAYKRKWDQVAPPSAPMSLHTTDSKKKE